MSFEQKQKWKIEEVEYWDERFGYCYGWPHWSYPLIGPYQRYYPYCIVCSKQFDLKAVDGRCAVPFCMKCLWVIEDFLLTQPRRDSERPKSPSPWAEDSEYSSSDSSVEINADSE